MAADTSIAIIFSRLDSSRLPGKALLPIGDRPLIGRAIDRARAIPGIDAVVVATTDRAVDDPIADFVRAEGIGLFRGDCDDVCGRALGCAQSFGAARFLRICGDSPFLDIGLAQSAVAVHRAMGLDLCTNVFPRSFPPGTSVEVVSTRAMARVAAAAAGADEREHMTRHFYVRPDLYRIVNLSCGDGRYAGVALTVDTPADLGRARAIVAGLGTRAVSAALDEVVALARQHDQSAGASC